MTEPTHENAAETGDTTESGEAIETRAQTRETPHSRTVITRSPDGTCQSTVTVTVQVTTTLGPAGPPAGMQRSPDENDTNTGGGPKGGLGVQRNPVTTTRSGDDRDTDPGSQTKGGLGVEHKHRA